VLRRQVRVGQAEARQQGRVKLRGDLFLPVLGPAQKLPAVT